MASSLLICGRHLEKGYVKRRCMGIDASNKVALKNMLQQLGSSVAHWIKGRMCKELFEIRLLCSFEALGGCRWQRLIQTLI